MTNEVSIDPKLDLVLERTIDLPRELIWKAWTTPNHLKNFFVPKPWTVEECEIDLRLGGKFRTVMVGPKGERVDNTGCYVNIVENELLVVADGLRENFRPNNELFMTVHLNLINENGKTRYKAIVLHNNAEAKKKHEEMGFYDGWGTVVDQMVDYIKANKNL